MNLTLLHEENLIPRTRDDTGPYLAAKWRQLAEHPLVGEARSVGLIGALELVRDKATRQFFDNRGEVGTICRDLCFQNGLVMRAVRDTMIVCAAPGDQPRTDRRAGREGAGSRFDLTLAQLPRRRPAAEVTARSHVAKSSLYIGYASKARAYARASAFVANQQQGVPTMSISIRAGLISLIAVAALYGCGKKEETAPAADATATAPAAATDAVPAADEEKVVNVFNWSDYIEPKVLEQFTAETGIKVNYDVFDSNEVLETKLLAGNTGYDVVVPSASFLERQIKAGVFRSSTAQADELGQPRHRSHAARRPARSGQRARRGPHVGHGRHRLQRRQDQEDRPERAGRQLEHRLRSEVRPRNSRTAASPCSTRPSEIVGAMLAYMGKDPNSQSEDDLKAAEEKLMAIRPYIRMIHCSKYIDALANGELCLAVGWSGDILQARDRAAEAGQGNVIKYSVPKEGTIIWFDMLRDPGGREASRQRARVHQLHDAARRRCGQLEPRQLREWQRGVAADDQRVGEQRPGVYPTPEVKAKLFPDLAESPNSRA